MSEHHRRPPGVDASAKLVRGVAPHLLLERVTESIKENSPFCLTRVISRTMIGPCPRSVWFRGMLPEDGEVYVNADTATDRQRERERKRSRGAFANTNRYCHGEKEKEIERERERQMFVDANPYRCDARRGPK